MACIRNSIGREARPSAWLIVLRALGWGQLCLLLVLAEEYLMCMRSSMWGRLPPGLVPAVLQTFTSLAPFIAVMALSWRQTRSRGWRSAAMVAACSFVAIWMVSGVIDGVDAGSRAWGPIATGSWVFSWAAAGVALSAPFCTGPRGSRSHRLGVGLTLVCAVLFGVAAIPLLDIRIPWACVRYAMDYVYLAPSLLVFCALGCYGALRAWEVLWESE